jgi:hypothetical protein
VMEALDVRLVSLTQLVNTFWRNMALPCDSLLIPTDPYPSMSNIEQSPQQSEEDTVLNTPPR